MTMFECFKLYALMASPMMLAFVGWGLWDKVEEKWEKRKNHD